MAMKLSVKGAAFIRHHEGFVDHWYLDPINVPTIGIGFTWRSDSFREWWLKNRSDDFARGAKMTRAEADSALAFLVEREYGAAVNKFLGGTKVPQHVWDGTVSPVFNLGPGSLGWKWAAAVKAGKYEEAAERLRNTGVTAGGKRLRGLVTRRREEAELIQFGDYEIGQRRHAEVVDDGVLVRGERGAAVMDLQRQLTAKGLYTGVADGIFGHGTEAAVLEFQRAVGLKPDGFAGPKTLAALSVPIVVEPKPVQTPQQVPAPAPKHPSPLSWGALLSLLGGVLYTTAKAMGWAP